MKFRKIVITHMSKLPKWPNGCSTCGVGNGEACASGFCGIANLAGFAELGVCGACVEDTDCPDPGQTCVGPDAGMGGLTPATCE